MFFLEAVLQQNIYSLGELPQPEVIAQALNVILVALEHSQCLDSTKKKPAAWVTLTHRAGRASPLLVLCVQGCSLVRLLPLVRQSLWKGTVLKKSHLWEVFSSSEIIKKQIDGRAASSPMRNLPLLHSPQAQAWGCARRGGRAGSTRQRSRRADLSCPSSSELSRWPEQTTYPSWVLHMGCRCGMCCQMCLSGWEATGWVMCLYEVKHNRILYSQPWAWRWGWGGAESCLPAWPSPVTCLEVVCSVNT